MNIEKIKCIPHLSMTTPMVYDEYLTYIEQLYAICKATNELIDQVNDLTIKFNNYDGNFEDIYDKISILNNNIEEIRNNIIQLKEDILNEVDIKLSDQYNLIINLMNQYQQLFNNNLNMVDTNLRVLISATNDRVEAVENGNIIVYDPTTGNRTNIDTALINVYSALRQNAITCGEFEALNLTCTGFQSYDISAYNFDINAKAILIV